MRALRVGVVDLETPDGVMEEGEGEGLRLLSSDCYPSLVEAYAQASMWERAIEAYQEGFVVGREGVEAVNYRVRGDAWNGCGLGRAFFLRSDALGGWSDGWRQAFRFCRQALILRNSRSSKGLPVGCQFAQNFTYTVLRFVN